MDNDYFYDGIGEIYPCIRPVHIEHLVQEGRGIFRMAAVEQGQTLPLRGR